jgi:hypothetical protein
MACTVAVSFFENPALDCESNTYPTFWPSKTVKRVRIIFENIRYISRERQKSGNTDVLFVVDLWVVE